MMWSVGDIDWRCDPKPKVGACGGGLGAARENFEDGLPWRNARSVASRQRAPRCKVGVEAGAVEPLAGGEQPIERQAGVSVARVPLGLDVATSPNGSHCLPSGSEFMPRLYQTSPSCPSAEEPVSTLVTIVGKR